MAINEDLYPLPDPDDEVCHHHHELVTRINRLSTRRVELMTAVVIILEVARWLVS